MTDTKYDLTALCLWREARGEGSLGMHAVANVIYNRALKNNTSCDLEVMRPWQFSSMTAKGDTQLAKYPMATDPAWTTAKSFARDAKAALLADITKKSTLYYAPASIDTNKTITLPNRLTIPFPKTWDRKHVEYAVTIGKHVFFREV